MPESSSSYNFQSITAETVIRQAYELIGILGDLTVAQQLDSAIRSINFILTDWSNRNINLWTLKQDFIALVPGVREYVLPIQTQKVIQCELRTSIRVNNIIYPPIPPTEVNPGNVYIGTAISGNTSGGDIGIAANAFDGNPLTACTQDTSNGWIGFNYQYQANPVVPQIITFVGIQSNCGTIASPVIYNLIIQASNDNVTWVDLRTLVNEPFIAGVNRWFNLDNILPFQYYRVLATGGSTLNIQELYFNNAVIDNTMTEVSRYEYLQYPRKNTLGRPTIYYVDYQILPKIFIWQNPSLIYNCIFYSAQQMIQTVTNCTQSIDITSAFYQPLVFGLAKSLAQKYAPDKVEMMNADYEQSLQTAITKNTVEVPFGFGVYCS